MAFPLFSKNKKAVLERCRDDYPTKMRLKYAPYYHAMEAQQGTNIRLDGHDMIMLSSNDYLGLSFHPKVIEAGRAAMLKWGTSTTGARTSNGSRAYHVELELKIAAFLGREACHVHAADHIRLTIKNLSDKFGKGWKGRAICRICRQARGLGSSGRLPLPWTDSVFWPV